LNFHDTFSLKIGLNLIVVNTKALRPDPRYILDNKV